MKIIKKIKENHCRVGLSIKPETKIEEIYEFLPYIHMCLVMTVEPGIYFIPSLLESARKNPDQAIYLNETLIQTLMPFGGARDEDNIVITEGAPRNLTAEAFAEIEWDGF